MRIALGVEYDGSDFHGFQKQKNLRTIQSALEAGLSEFAQENIEIYGAGRTDTGVHATGQVVHFDTSLSRAMHAWTSGTNSFLSQTISLQWAKIVPEEFHARYSAYERTYQYHIYNHAVRPALRRRHVAWQYRPLDHELMHMAAQYLIGEHDFSSFRGSECQSLSPMRHMKAISVARSGTDIVVTITANAFLHHMVRNIMGVLMKIGSKKQPVEWIQDVLAAKDRRMGAETASPYGLYLTHIQYPEQFGLPK